MKISKCALAFALLFQFQSYGRAAAQAVFQPPSPDTNPYLDPAFQDYAETAYGYRNPKNAPKYVNDFRDALTSPETVTFKTARPPATGGLRTSVHPEKAPGQPGTLARSEKVPGQYYQVTFANEPGPLSAYVNPPGPEALSGFKAEDYVFVSVLPRTEDHADALRSLSGTGFKFAGEKAALAGGEKNSLLLGWVPYSNLESVYKHPQVRRVAIETRAAAIPFRARVRFTLRAPGGQLAGVFVSGFIRQLSAGAGFASENVTRLPQNAGNAKFTAFDVTGSLPVDRVGGIARSPFVAAVEIQ